MEIWGSHGTRKWGSLALSPLPYSMRAQSCSGPHPFLSPLDQAPEVSGRKEGVKRNDDDFDFFPLLVSEPGEGGCFASWTSVANSLPDNHRGAFIAF